jgi:hypothetical protein
MGVALETILAAKANITGTTFENLTPGTGDTFTVRDFAPGSLAYAEEIWGLDDTSPAQFSLASPRMNDGQEGLRLSVPSGALVGPAEEPQVLMPGPGRLPVYRADTLKVQVEGTAADNTIFAYTVRYENLEGADTQLRSWAEVEPMIEKTFGILVQPTNGTADYGTPVTLDSVDDRLEADKKYAWLGCTIDLPTCLVALSGPDTGRYRIGMPGKVDPMDGGDYFARLSAKYQAPSIPIIKSNNKGSTLIWTADAAAGATPNICLILAQLSG